MNSKHVLFFAVAVLVGIAFYVVRAKERRLHASSSSYVATDPAPRAKSAAPPPLPPKDCRRGRCD